MIELEQKRNEPIKEIFIGHLCECKPLDYQPATIDNGNIRERLIYYCKRCGKELGFRKMDLYHWSQMPGPALPDNNPYSEDKEWS